MLNQKQLVWGQAVQLHATWDKSRLTGGVLPSCTQRPHRAPVRVLSWGHAWAGGTGGPPHR